MQNNKLNILISFNVESVWNSFQYLEVKQLV